jgi:integrase
VPLTDTKVRNAKPRDKLYKLGDGHALFLHVEPNGSKLWRYYYRLGKKQNLFAIGTYPSVSLADARATCVEARKLVEQGIHPAHYRKLERARLAAGHVNTFKAVAVEWIDQRRQKWTPYYLSQVEHGLENNVYREIGSLPIKSVTAHHILDILKKVEKRGAHSVALLIRQWCSAIFRYAVATMRADGDPAAALAGAITKPRVKHRKPLPRPELTKFQKKVDKAGGYRTTAIALRLLLLTFVRPVELRAAKWTEFDLEHAEWRIPAERMKMREEHVVPLSRQALALLQELRTITGSAAYLFPNNRRPNTYMTGTTMNRALERMGYGGKFSSHGFRATASTMLNEMGYKPDVIERQLAHKERNKVRASYNQAQYLPERRQMLQQWADYLDNLKNGEKVVHDRFGMAA